MVFTSAKEETRIRVGSEPGLLCPPNGVHESPARDPGRRVMPHLYQASRRL